MTLLSHKVGKEKVRAALERRRGRWWKRRMRDEWNHRACRTGVLADMSARYETAMLESESGRYVKHVMDFLRCHITGKTVVEVGSGTGRITKALLTLKPTAITCIELSPAMEARHRGELGCTIPQITYKSGFAQDLLPSSREYDIAVCSLVLVHNVGDPELEALLERLARSAEHVFIFEDVRERQSSPATRILSERELLDRLRPYFEIERRQIYILFDDQILSLHLRSK